MEVGRPTAVVPAKCGLDQVEAMEVEKNAEIKLNSEGTTLKTCGWFGCGK